MWQDFTRELGSGGTRLRRQGWGGAQTLFETAHRHLEKSGGQDGMAKKGVLMALQNEHAKRPAETRLPQA